MIPTCGGALNWNTRCCSCEVFYHHAAITVAANRRTHISVIYNHFLGWETFHQIDVVSLLCLWTAWSCKLLLLQRFSTQVSFYFTKLLLLLRRFGFQFCQHSRLKETKEEKLNRGHIQPLARQCLALKHHSN